MQEYYQFRDRIIRITSTCIVVASLIGLFTNRPDIGAGILLGGIAAVFKFYYLSQTIALLQGHSLQSGKKHLYRRGLIRYGLTAACLIAAMMLQKHINFWAVAIGLFSVMGVLFVDQIRLGALSKEES